MSSEWEYVCGRCGKKIPKSRRIEPFNSVCATCGIPHMRLVRRGEPPYDDWECADCGETGTLREMEGSQCLHIPDECSYCGLRPYCAPDCRGVSQALGSASISAERIIPE